MQVAAQTKPDLIIFVMDGSIGQAAHDQAKAFKDTVEVCAAFNATPFALRVSFRCLLIFFEDAASIIQAQLPRFGVMSAVLRIFRMTIMPSLTRDRGLPCCHASPHKQERSLS